MIRLRRYWLTFESSTNPRTGFGYGVSAYSVEDALSLLKAERLHEFLGESAMPTVREVIEDVDVRTLDGHVRPNMGCPSWRGVWWPNCVRQPWEVEAPRPHSPAPFGFWWRQRTVVVGRSSG